MYFKSDIKNLLKNKFLIIVSSIIFAISIGDSLSSFISVITDYDYYIEALGVNPFQYWLLINPSGWGAAVFNILFWIAPMFIVTVNYYQERHSSVEVYKIYRNSKCKYYLSKNIAVFVYTFLLFAVSLTANVCLTYALFPSGVPLNNQYKFYIPKEGSFARTLYDIDPFVMCVVFCVLYALILALLSVIYTNIHMIFNFKNQYIAMIIPVVIAYALSFLFDSSITLWHYNAYFFLQPLAHSSTTEIITWGDIGITYGVWCFLCILLTIFSVRRNRDLM